MVNETEKLSASLDLLIILMTRKVEFLIRLLFSLLLPRNPLSDLIILSARRLSNASPTLGCTCPWEPPFTVFPSRLLLISAGMNATGPSPVPDWMIYSTLSLSVVGLIGNLLIVGASLVSKQLRGRCQLFIAGLAATDVVVCAYLVSPPLLPPEIE